MGAVSDWPVRLKRWWFPAALVLAIFAGYGVGKDRAMTENNRDAASSTLQQPEG